MNRRVRTDADESRNRDGLNGSIRRRWADMFSDTESEHKYQDLTAEDIDIMLALDYASDKHNNVTLWTGVTMNCKKTPTQ